MKKVLVAKQVSPTKWKVQKKYRLEKKDWFNIIITVVTVGYVSIRLLVR